MLIKALTFAGIYWGGCKLLACLDGKKLSDESRKTHHVYGDISLISGPVPIPMGVGLLTKRCVILPLNYQVEDFTPPPPYPVETMGQSYFPNQQRPQYPVYPPHPTPPPLDYEMDHALIQAQSNHTLFVVTASIVTYCATGLFFGFLPKIILSTCAFVYAARESSLRADTELLSRIHLLNEGPVELMHKQSIGKKLAQHKSDLAPTLEKIFKFTKERIQLLWRQFYSATSAHHEERGKREAQVPEWQQNLMNWSWCAIDWTNSVGVWFFNSWFIKTIETRLSQQLTRFWFDKRIALYLPPTRAEAE